MTKQNGNPLVTGGGTEATRFNALRHGVLSRYTVLPWEDRDAYDTVLEALAAEHQPVGPTEEHLVEELAGILWRKRRLRLAEMAVHRQGLATALSPLRETAKAALAHMDVRDPERAVYAIRATAAGTQEEQADLAADEAMTLTALAILESPREDAYEAALAALRQDTQRWWFDRMEQRPEDVEEGAEPYRADISGLRRFIEAEVLPWFEARKQDLANRPLIREQAFGEALDPDKLERLGRYEVHLDRKFERMLAMLLKLKDLRRPQVRG